ncbi:MAG: ABC transporter substrate-binding protein [Cyanobacteria bacterium HKST-UBA04]|nr:ABC transporter substrate-binding protein [Cyanobacteria bacterium HKST-UBA04]
MATGNELMHPRLLARWIWAGCFGAAMLLPLAGCQPPDMQLRDAGHPIIKVEAKVEHPPVYRNVTVDGAQLLESPYPVGEFGRTLHSASIGAGPKTFNPLVSNDATSSAMAGLMFSGLVNRNAHSGEFEGWLAQGFEIGADQRTYTVRLRRGVTWSDGVPITADDVVFTWNKLIKTGMGNRSNLDVILVDGKAPTVAKVDDYTVQFVTPVPFAPFLGSLGNPILPKHVVEPVLKQGPKAFDSFWGVNADPASFVVSGPFKLKQYETGHRVVMERNPAYFVVNANHDRLPYVKQYVTEFVRDLNAVKLLFEQGRVDTLGVPGQDVFYVKQLLRPKFDLYDLGPNTGTTFFGFNLNPRQNRKTGKPYVDPIKSAWFGNLKFRQAVDYAIRRDQLVQNILRGVGEPLFTPEALSSIYLHPKLAKGHPHDVAKARRLLQEAGFHWDAAGQLLDGHGHRVQFELLTNAGNTERESVGVSIKEDLEGLGMKVNFKPIEFNVLVNKLAETMDWEAVIIGFTGSTVEPHGGVNLWNSQGALHLFNLRKPDLDGGPYRYVVEPWERAVDDAFNRGSKVIDVDQRKPYYWRYQELVYDNLPVSYLYSPNIITAVNKRLQNIDPSPVTGSVMDNLESIWIKRK